MSRRRRSVVALLAVAALLVGVGYELVSDETDLLLVVAWLVVVVTATTGALAQYRRRVAVDREGVHVSTMFRRRTYRWDEVSVVRPASASDGRSNVQLIQRGGKVIDLPGVAGQFNVFRRWHDAVRPDR